MPWLVNITPFHYEAEPNLSRILEQIADCRRQNCDLIVVTLHWGLEFEAYPDPCQREWAQTFADAGADVVVGHHPHVTQFSEVLHPIGRPEKDVPVIYSLGNLTPLFSCPESSISLVARITCEKSSRFPVKRLSLYPVALMEKLPERRMTLVRLRRLIEDPAEDSETSEYIAQMADYADMILGGGKQLYPVALIGKTFTASLLAKGVAERKLDLNKPLDHYIEGLPRRYYPGLLKLATHHSGYHMHPLSFMDLIKCYLLQNREGGLFHTNPFHGHTTEKLCTLLTEAHLRDKPYRYKYSNFGYAVLAYIVGESEGSDYYTVADRYIREELRLSDTGYGDIPITGYDNKNQPCRPWIWDREDMITPAAGIHSSIADLLEYASRNVDGSLPYVEICHTDRRKSSIRWIGCTNFPTICLFPNTISPIGSAASV